MNIGESIKKYRKEKGLTQTELAIKSNLSKNAIYNYENNKRTPNIDMLNKIAIALNVSLERLLGGQGDSIHVCENMDDLKEYIDNELNLIETDRQYKEYEVTPEYEQEMKRLEAEYNNKNWIKHKNTVSSFEHILIALQIELSLLDDNGVTKIKLFDHKDGYTKIFNTLEEAELFFNEITHGIQSSVDRLKYYDKNNK